MAEDGNFLKTTYTLHLKKSQGLGEGVKGYGLQFEPRTEGPTVTKVFQGGEAFRSGLVQEGDILKEIDNVSVDGRPFMEVMDSIVSKTSCSFTFAGNAGF